MEILHSPFLELRTEVVRSLEIQTSEPLPYGSDLEPRDRQAHPGNTDREKKMPGNWALGQKRRNQERRLRRGFQGGRRQQGGGSVNPEKLLLVQRLQGLQTGTGSNDMKVISASEEQFWLSGAG